MYTNNELENREEGKEDSYTEESNRSEEEEIEEQPLEAIDNVEESSVEETIDEIIKSEGDIPPLETYKVRKSLFSSEKKRKLRASIAFSHDDILDFEKVDKKYKKDFSYFEKIRKFNKIARFRWDQDPFSYAHQKEYWNLKLYNKFHFLLKRFLKHLNTEPFGKNGVYVLFEFECLYHPRRCDAYVKKHLDLASKCAKKFAKASKNFNKDVYANIDDLGINSPFGNYGKKQSEDFSSTIDIKEDIIEEMKDSELETELESSK